MPLNYDQMVDLVNRNQSGESHIPIIDVRGEDEVSDTGMIPTAVNVPLNELADAVHLKDSAFAEKYGSEKPEKSKPVVLYCLKGMRAEKAREVLEQEGYTAINTYPGSWEEWSAHH
ncbi:Heat shock protein 67Bb [Trypanosoma theileri]|uniref:Heat shock protein 67Bb n=1 Tax=Trypanosoma theileri TaxID=67003 RepID=A0A1X0NHS7_9TRYP|nr:Heat shock protein 67Bb [Trypanosoma theileri]ORC84314.1 Heat shock protein 67Bb [Trypanosoma theileri]